MLTRSWKSFRRFYTRLQPRWFFNIGRGFLVTEGRQFGNQRRSYPMHSAEYYGTKAMVAKQAKLLLDNGWDVVVKKGDVYAMRATINVPIGGENGITPQASPCLFQKMGSYREI
jgi:hypothetical protein